MQHFESQKSHELVGCLRVASGGRFARRLTTLIGGYPTEQPRARLDETGQTKPCSLVQRMGLFGCSPFLLRVPFLFAQRRPALLSASLIEDAQSGIEGLEAEGSTRC
jgi:hypothetical protein